MFRNWKKRRDLERKLNTIEKSYALVSKVDIGDITEQEQFNARVNYDRERADPIRELEGLKTQQAREEAEKFA